MPVLVALPVIAVLLLAAWRFGPVIMKLINVAIKMAVTA